MFRFIPALLRRIATLALPLLASLPHAGASPAQTTYEAEAGYSQNSTIAEDPTASGGQYLKLGQSGLLMTEVLAEYEGGSLVVKFRSPDVDRIVDLSLDGVPIGTRLCRATVDGEWDTFSIPPLVIVFGIHLLRIALSADSLEGLVIDCMTICAEPSGTTCSGCTVAPLTPAVAKINEQSILLPPLPGVAGKISAGLKAIIKTRSVDILSVTPTPHDGECELKPKDPAKPCGEKSCVEKTGCSVSFTIKFRANNYVRPPFYDRHEDVVLPDGSKRKFKRSPMSYELDVTGVGKCGQGQNITVTFENGTLTQSLSCNSCL